MVYKRVIERNGKKYTYYYENYRDEKGVVRNRILGSKPPRKGGAKSMVFALFLFLVVLPAFIYTTYVLIPPNMTGASVVEANSKISKGIFGLVIAGPQEVVEESFDQEEIDLRIKKSSDATKNERMEFFVHGKPLKLSFDLLNYSTVISSVQEVVAVDKEAIQQSEIQVSVNPITGLTVQGEQNATEIEESDQTNQTSHIESIQEDEAENTIQNTEGIQEAIEELEAEELEILLEDAIIPAEEFDIEVEIPAEETYKWGYNLVLNDLTFIAKIDVEAEDALQIWNENTIQIGNSLLSFEDLEKEGYSVRLEKPGLAAPAQEVVEEVQEIESQEEKKIEKEDTSNQSVSNITDQINQTNQTSHSEGNQEQETEDEEVSETVEEVFNETRVLTEVNETEQIGQQTNNASQEEDEQDDTAVQDDVNESDLDQAAEDDLTEIEEAREEAQEDLGEESELAQEQETEEGEEEAIQAAEDSEDEEAPEPEPITGDVIAGAFRSAAALLPGSLTGLVIDAVSSEEQLENKITVYIERDFKNTNYAIGDTIVLDPTLIIIPIVDAQHLDQNKTYITSIFEEVEFKDDVWSDPINQGEYVRVTFKEPLSNQNDITIHVRSADNSTAHIEVYEEDEDVLISSFLNITEEEKTFQILLTNLSADSTYTQDTFDLKIFGSVEFDLIIDPLQYSYTYADASERGHTACEKGHGGGNNEPTNPFNCNFTADAKDFDNVSKSDNNWWNTSIANGQHDEYDIQIFHMNLIESPENISSLNITWEGKTHAGTDGNNDTMKVELWNASAGSWVNITPPIENGSTTDIIRTYNISSGIADFINESGNNNWVYLWTGMQISCPFIYAHNGEEWKLEHESFPFSVIRSAETTTFDRLKHLQEVNGTYRLQVREELDEISYIDSFNFYVVDHPGTGFVMPDMKGTMHTIQPLIRPRTCVEKNGDDCLDQILRQDAFHWKDSYKEIDTSDENTWKNEIIVTFDKPHNATQAKVFANIMKQEIMSHAWQYYLSEIGENNWKRWQQVLDLPLFSNLFKQAFEENVNLKVEALMNGTYKTVGSIKAGRHIQDDFLFAFDISQIKEKDLTLRFSSTTGFYEIHYVGVDYSEDEKMMVTRLSPREARMNNETTLTDTNFTSDDTYITLVQGDIIDLTYDALPKSKNLNRDYVVDIKGYYNFINFENKSNYEFVKGTKSWIRSLFDSREIPRHIIPNVRLGNTIFTDYIKIDVTANTTTSNVTSAVAISGLSSIANALEYAGTKNMVRLDSRRLVAVFEETGNDHVCAWSDDEGKTWESKTGPGETLRYLSVATNGTTVFIVAEQTSFGEIYYIQNTSGGCPGGATMSALSSTNLGSSPTRRGPSIAYNGNTSRYVMCYQNGSTSLGFAYLDANDSSPTWTAVNVQDSVTYGGCGIAIDTDGEMHLCVDDDDSIRYFSSDDNFATTNQNKIVDTAATNYDDCDISVYNGTVAITTHVPGSKETHTFISGNDGSTFAEYTLLGTTEYPNVCVDPYNNTHVVLTNTTGSDSLIHRTIEHRVTGYKSETITSEELLNTSYRPTYNYLLCHNYPDGNRMTEGKLEILSADDPGNTVYFTNHLLESSYRNSLPVITSNISSPDPLHANASLIINLTATDANPSQIAQLRGYVEFFMNNASVHRTSVLITNNTNTEIGRLLSGNLSIGDNVSAQVWVEDGVENTSNVELQTLTVENYPPSTPILLFNSSSATNRTAENLTVYISGTKDDEGQNVTNITDWRLNGTSIAVVNFPFDTNNDSGSRDYSTYANDIDNITGATWNVTGKVGGSYFFDGDTDIIRINDSTSINVTKQVSVEAWIYPTSADIQDFAGIVAKDEVGTFGQFALAYDSSASDILRFGFDRIGSGNEEVDSQTGIPDNEWTHVVGTWDDYNNTLAIYVNGELREANTSVTNSITKFGAPLVIGNRNAGMSTHEFVGHIDEVKVYNRTLTAEQIRENYNAGLNNHSVNRTVSQETKPRENWSVQVTSNDGNGDGAATLSSIITINAPPTPPTLVLNSSTGANNETDNLTVYIDGSVDQDGDNITNITDWRLNGTSIAVLNFPFDTKNVTNVTDYSTFGIDGGLGNDSAGTKPTWTSSGKIGGAYDFDGVANYMLIFDDASNTLPYEMTLSAWVNLDALAGSGTHFPIIKKRDGGADSWQLTVNSTAFRVTVDTGSPTHVYSQTVPQTDRWIHAAATWNGSYVRLFINGSVESTTTGVTGEMSDTTDHVVVGYGPGFSATSSPFNGIIDEVLVFNRSLSKEQIKEIYTAGFNNRSINRTVSQETNVKENWSVQVTPNDGKEDGNSTLSSNLTIISNTPPTIEIGNPVDQNTTTDRTPTFNWTGTDPQGDSLVYDFNLTCNDACSADNRIQTGIYAQNFTPTTDLLYLIDNGYFYNWTVRACENATTDKLCSDWSTARVINITALLSLSLPTAIVEFGEMNLLESRNTTNASIDSFSIRNAGNARVNVSINASQLWKTVSVASSNLQCRVGSYVENASSANTTWFNIPLTLTTVQLVEDLNYTDTADLFTTDILITVPEAEGPGPKNSSILFTAVLSE